MVLKVSRERRDPSIPRDQLSIMRILLLADVHSNWSALQAIAAAEPDFDACLFLGDLVDYGTDPVPCIDWARRHVTHAVRGNHDHAVAQRVPPRSGSGLRRLAAVARPLHWGLLDPHRTKYLARLPLTRRLELGGRSFYLVHATPRDPMDEYLTDDAAAWTTRLEQVDADFICVGHSHVAFDLPLPRGRVLNPGSVGQPRDGDPRAAYAVVEDGRVELRRVAYDIDATLRQMRSLGVEDWAVELTAAMLRTGGQLSRDELDRIQ
jgi:putative phosphoesterase